MARFLETLPYGFVLIDTGGGIVSLANGQARRLLELPPDVEPRNSSGLRALFRALEAQPAAAGMRPWHLRVELPARALRVVGVYVAPAEAAMIVRAEVLRNGDLHGLLVDRLGLDAAEARLAVRIRRGLSNRAIAEAFGVPEGTVKSRVHRLFARLGLKRRVQLVNAIDQSMRGVAPVQEPSPPGETTATPALPVPVLTASVRDRVEEFLDRIEIGFAALGGNEVLYCNVEAWQFLGPGRDRLERPIQRCRARVAEAAHRLTASRGPLAPSLHCSLPTKAGGSRLRVTLWPAGPDFSGVEIRKETIRQSDLQEWLIERFALSPHQAQVAVLIGRGLSNREIAAAMGLKVGTVRSLSATAYARLGVRNRTELAGLLADLAESSLHLRA